MEAGSGSAVKEIAEKFRERKEKLRKFGIEPDVPGAVEEIDRLFREEWIFPDRELIKAVYLEATEGDDELLKFVLERVKDIEDPVERIYVARDAIEEYILKFGRNKLIDWILHRLFPQIY